MTILGPFSGILTDPAGNRLVYGPAGLSIALVDDASPETPTPDPTPTPTPVPAPRGRRQILWHHGWAGPHLADWPTTIRSQVTTVCLGMAQSANPQARRDQWTGRLATPPGVTRQEITSLRTAGVDVFVGIGGSNSTGLELRTADQIKQLVDSCLAHRDALATNGIAWDLETEPGSTWTQDAVIVASQALLAKGLKIGIWSGTWGGRLAAWGAVARVLGEQLDHWQRCLYDFPQAGDSRLTPIAANAIRELRPYLSRDDQVVLSFAPVGSASRTPVDVARAAYAAARQQAPLTGFSVWEDYQDNRAGWSTWKALTAA
jgi:hypothetical protein